MSWSKALQQSFLLDAVGNVGNVFRVGIWTWTSRHPWALNHQAMGESGLASSVFPLAIQTPHPRLKILAMTFFEKQLHLCESFNAMTIFWSLELWCALFTGGFNGCDWSVTLVLWHALVSFTVPLLGAWNRLILAQSSVMRDGHWCLFPFELGCCSWKGVIWKSSPRGEKYVQGVISQVLLSVEVLIIACFPAFPLTWALPSCIPAFFQYFCVSAARWPCRLLPTCSELIHFPVEQSSLSLWFFSVSIAS